MTSPSQRSELRVVRDPEGTSSQHPRWGCLNSLTCRAQSQGWGEQGTCGMKPRQRPDTQSLTRPNRQAHPSTSRSIPTGRPREGGLGPNQHISSVLSICQANHRRQKPESVSTLSQTTQHAVLTFDARSVAPENCVSTNTTYQIRRPRSLPQPDSVSHPWRWMHE